MEFINQIVNNWESIAVAILAVIPFLQILAKLTPSPKDDTALAYIYDFLSAITPNDRSLIKDKKELSAIKNNDKGADK